MKKIIIAWLTGIAGVFMAACSSTRTVSIETYSPAEVTFPASVGTIVVVNNSAVQSPVSGHLYKQSGTIKPDTVPADSAAWDACTALGVALHEPAYFNEVLLFHDTIRLDGMYDRVAKLTPRQVEDICSVSGADAVISLDGLWFNLCRETRDMPGGYVTGEIDVKVEGTVRAYLPGRANPLATVYLNDSVYWGREADNLLMLGLLLPTPEQALREAGKYVVMGAYKNFVPHWSGANRWFYTGSSSRWKEATAFAAREKWEEAAAYWKRFFEQERTATQRAKAAMNMALYYELKGDLLEALAWGKKGVSLFNGEDSGKNKKDSTLARLYVDTLMERIREEKKLNIQFGNE
ncbi:MAG: tetratricopeptide repeat protein [Parabacteroides sp.]|nr:tetratricopeptide repeat protein [Parabacteroides sp.]